MQVQTPDRPSHKSWLTSYRLCGTSGYLLAPFNVMAGYEYADGGCLIGYFEGAWPLLFPWMLLTFTCLMVKDPVAQHRSYRVEMVLSLATWQAPAVSFAIWRLSVTFSPY